MPRTPCQVVEAWSAAFNRQDADALAALYAPDAVNWQVADQPLEGREAVSKTRNSRFDIRKSESEDRKTKIAVRS